MTTDVLFAAFGDSAAVDALVHQSTRGRNFSFEAILPTPAALEVDDNSFSQDGFNAVAGDWTAVAQRRMLREHAAVLGFPFPLESRSQVIECYAALGAIGSAQLALGKQIQTNLERHGHGYASSWRKANWGIECNVEAVIENRTVGRFEVAFQLCGAAPKKVFTELSTAHRDLSFVVRYVDESGKRAAEFELHAGRQVRKEVVDGTMTKDTIRSFRRQHARSWLTQVAGATLDGAFDVGELGAVSFRGSNISLAFALQRMHAGETAEHFSIRYPEVSEGQMKVLKGLVQSGYR